MQWASNGDPRRQYSCMKLSQHQAHSSMALTVQARVFAHILLLFVFSSSLPCLHASTALTAGSSSSSSRQAGNCPAWLSTYKEFHAANRARPNATYIVLDCSEGHACNGIGDRIKGVMFLLRMAALYDKVLVVHWEQPAPVHQYLKPASIDWTIQGLDEHQLIHQPHPGSNKFNFAMQLRESPATKSLIFDGKNIAEFKMLKVLRTQVVVDPAHTLQGSDDNTFIKTHGQLAFYRCLFQFLFTPTESLRANTDAALQSLYDDPAEPYMAFHWRTGGMVNELKLTRPATTHFMDTSRLRQIMSALMCMEHITEMTHGTAVAGRMSLAAALQHIPPPSQKPLLLLTDNNMIRQFVVEGNLRYMVSPNETVAHTRQTHNYKGGTSSTVHNSFVELLMLAKADCLLYSHSGYSLAALWMSNSSCHISLHDCLKLDSTRFKGLDVKKLRKH